MEIDYDPKQIGYAELLKVFWENHNPHRPAWSQQYKSLILYHDAEQRRLAEQIRDRLEEQSGRSLHTDIAAYEGFTLAEDYHQKYYLRRHKLVTAELKNVYPDLRGFVNSTAAARLNGYVAGHGSMARLEREQEQYGLSQEALRSLKSFLSRRVY